MKIYHDVCCLNRPFDDLSQARVRLEAEAFRLILSRFDSGEWTWVVSEVLLLEIARTPDNGRRSLLSNLIRPASEIVRLDQMDVARALELRSKGFDEYDAMHLVCAEFAAVDIFLTTDDRLIRTARRIGDELHVRVDNPHRWLEEVTGT